MEKKFFRVLATLVSRLILGKSDLDELVFSKYHSFQAYLEMTLNYVAWRLGLRKSFRVVSIVIEPTNFCTLRCTVCPTRDDMSRKRGYMDFNLYKKIVDENSHVQFVNLFLWGEPFLHPQIIDMITYARDRGIEVEIYSNGTLVDSEMGRKILETGIDRIIFSLDGVDGAYESVRNYPYIKVEKNILGFLALRNEMKARTMVDVSMVVGRETECAVAELKERWAPIADTVRLQRQNTYEKKERTKSCFELWRGNVVVHWDGTVVPCFIDYDASVKLGDAGRESIRSIYNGEAFQKIRSMHARGEFPEICYLCSEYETEVVSSRVA